jgi:hypothetical protein
MTDERITDARARCEAATPGPWQALERECWWIVEQIDEPHEGVVLLEWQGDPDQVPPHEVASARADHAFIAAARSDLPDLLADRALLMAVVEAARETVTAVCADWDTDNPPGVCADCHVRGVCEAVKLASALAALEADEDYVPCDVVDCIHHADGLCYAPATRTRIGCVGADGDA